MTGIFTTVLNMSMYASVAALAVMIARVLLKRAPKVFSYALWAVVLFRLVSPFSIESAFGLMPGAPQAESITGFQTSGVQAPPLHSNAVVSAASSGAGTTANLDFASQIIQTYNSGAIPETANMNFDIALQVAAGIWLAGFAALLLYGAIGYIRLKRQVRYATLVRGNVYETDKIKMPFVLGFICTKIYFPVNLDPMQQSHILRHEQVHIKRRDYLIKPIAFAALALHWFNPLAWVSYFLMSKDMEMSCDEAVLRQADEDIRGEYSASLLEMSVNRNRLLCPLAFGGSNAKERVVNVLSFKKPKLWVTVLSMVVVCIFLVGFASNRQADVEANTARVYNAYEMAAALDAFCLDGPARLIIGASFSLPEPVVITNPDITITGGTAGMPVLVVYGDDGFIAEAGAGVRLEGLALARGAGDGSGILIQGGYASIQDVEITGFTNSGVRIMGGGTFEMFDGYIHSNAAYRGGGVYIGEYSSFIMHGGLIGGNVAVFGGGGVSAYRSSSFDMLGGRIHGNTLVD